MLENKIKCFAILLGFIVLCGATWFVIPPAEHVWQISDASIAQERRFLDWFHSFSSGLLAIRIIGNLTEPAQVETPLGRIDLPQGELDFIVFGSEAWTSAATLRYSPAQNTRGNLKFVVCIGSSPLWFRRPPPSALPTLYTGGWTAYYPRTDSKAWNGRFHHGIKWGEFTYWDEAGNIMHQEEWENGRKKN